MEEFDRIFKKMDLFFDRLFDRSLIEYLPYAARWKPGMNLYETEKSCWVVMEIPGVDKREIDVRIEAGCLVVSGVRRLQVPKGVVRCHSMEISLGPFSRALEIGDLPIKDEVKASYKNGLLIIELPKRET